MGWCMSPELFVVITYCLLVLCFVTLGLLFAFLLLRREFCPRPGGQPNQSPPASVTGQRDHSASSPRAPPVAGDGGEMG